MFCCIDSKPIPSDRVKRKGLSAACCSDECYQTLRKIRRERGRAYKFQADDRALLLRLRRAKFTLADFALFAPWWAEQRKARKQANGAQVEAANTVRHESIEA